VEAWEDIEQTRENDMTRMETGDTSSSRKQEHPSPLYFFNPFSNVPKNFTLKPLSNLISSRRYSGRLLEEERRAASR
jgi:hypothetical protein